MNEIYAAGVLAAAINRIPYANKFVKDKIVWVEIAGDSPHATKKNAPFIVGRGPVPRQRSCTRPLSSVVQERLLLTRSGAGAPELQMGGRIVRVSQRSRGTGPRATVVGAITNYRTSLSNVFLMRSFSARKASISDCFSANAFSFSVNSFCCSVNSFCCAPSFSSPSFRLSH